MQPDGRLTDAFIARGLSVASNAEALRLVQAMPRWRPARYQNAGYTRMLSLRHRSSLQPMSKRSTLA